MVSLLKLRWLLVLFALSLTLFLIGHFMPGAGMFMAFAAGTFSAATCLGIFLFVSSLNLGDINDYEEIIKNRNMAYALYLLVIGLIIVISYGAAFMVFLTLKD